MTFLKCSTIKENSKSLNVESTYITKTGLDKFQKSRPELKIWTRSALTDEEFQIVKPFRNHKVRIGVNYHGLVTSIDLQRLKLTPGKIGPSPAIEVIGKNKTSWPLSRQSFPKTDLAENPQECLFLRCTDHETPSRATFETPSLKVFV